MVRLIFAISLCLLPWQLLAQDTPRPSDAQVLRIRSIERIISQLRENLPTYSEDCQRIALMMPDFKEKNVSAEEAMLIRNQLAQQVQKTAFTVVDVPEFHEYRLTRVFSSDSGLLYQRNSPTRMLRTNSEATEQLVKKHKLDGIIYTQITYDSLIGHTVSMQLVQQRSREIIWNRTFHANIGMVRARESQHLVALGMGMNSVRFVNGIGGYRVAIPSVQLRWMWRQPVNEARTVNLFTLTQFSMYQTNFKANDSLSFNFWRPVPELGLGYSLSFLNKKNSSDYWFEGYQSFTLHFFNRMRTSINQGLLFNFTRNLVVMGEVSFITGAPELHNYNNVVTLNQFQYAVRLNYRF